MILPQRWSTIFDLLGVGVTATFPMRALDDVLALGYPVAEATLRRDADARRSLIVGINLAFRLSSKRMFIEIDFRYK